MNQDSGAGRTAGSLRRGVIQLLSKLEKQQSKLNVWQPPGIVCHLEWNKDQCRGAYHVLDPIIEKLRRMEKLANEKS